jgi:hypothetical protein
MTLRRLSSVFLILAVFSIPLSWAAPQSQPQAAAVDIEQKLLAAMHTIRSQPLYDYVRELASEKYGGRLTGTEEFNLCARWVAGLFQKWGLQPAGDKGTYFQAFPDPYTLIFPGCELVLNIPWKEGLIKKSYRYEDEFIPGGTSASGDVTAEVVYVGYGISAPELGYDDYRGVDVRGKIVLMEREVPVDPDKDPELFKKWRPYSFHQYKLETADDKGARGMIYNYGPIGNPNNSYRQGFIYSHVGPAVVDDIFAGTGRNHKEVVDMIGRKLLPQSFATGKIMTIKNVCQHHPEGIGFNVLAFLPGCDPVLKDEVLIVGAHLDHLGRLWELMPGANDNASSVAVMLGLAEAMRRCEVKPRRSVMFMAFGAEEQGVVGSEYYLNHPFFPLNKTVAFINMENAGVGDRFHILAGKNFPDLWSYLDRANQKYIHRIMTASAFANIARPRQDTARFLWKGVPSVTLSSQGGRSYYHVTKDDPSTITPEIMEDAAQLLLMAVMDMASADKLDFRPKTDE